jgi:hypothetical protein
VEESGAGADRQSILQFMTTEHFTLQTAKAVANAEIGTRLQLYLGTLSSSLIAPRPDRAAVRVGLRLPSVRVGPAPSCLLSRRSDAWTAVAGHRGVADLRAGHEPHPPLLPGGRPGDGTLFRAAVHRRPLGQPYRGRHPDRGNPWWQALLTAGAIVVVVNSVLAGVFAGLLWRSVAGPSGPVPLALCAVAGFLLSMMSLGGYGQRTWRRPRSPSRLLKKGTTQRLIGPSKANPACRGRRSARPSPIKA